MLEDTSWRIQARASQQRFKINLIIYLGISGNFPTEHQQDKINNKGFIMTIRKADDQKDYDKVWDIFTNVISTGDTYVFDPNTPKEALHHHWFADYMDTFVR
ncbi:hypothetical protein D3C87_335640 [compost metagenome]